MTIIYPVQPGDTWLSIANDHHVSVLELMQLNANRKGMSDKHPQYANKPTFANNGYELKPNLTVRIPEKRQAVQPKPAIFERKKEFNSNSNAMFSVRTTQKKPLYDAQFAPMAFMPTIEQLNAHDFQPKAAIEPPKDKFQKFGDDVGRRVSATGDAIATAARHQLENMEDQVKQTAKTALGTGVKVVKKMLSNPARVMLQSTPMIKQGHNALLMFSPKTARLVEGEVPIISGVSFSGSAFFADANSSINIFNGQAYVGGGGGIEGNTKTKALDPMPSASVALVLIPQKYLTNKQGNVTLQSAANGTDDILGGSSVGAQIGYRGIIAGVDVNHDKDEKTGAYSPKINYTLGLGIPGGKGKLSKIRDALKKDNGVDIGGGTGWGTKVGDPMWPAE